MAHLNHTDTLRASTPEPSLPALAVRLLAALLQVQWRRAARVLTVGDGIVH